MYTYSVFSCSPPIIDENDQIIGWCGNPGETVTHTVIERVDGVQMSKFVHTCTRAQFLEILFQILNALQYAFESVRYTHYDLHTGNVMVTQLPSRISIPYHDGGYINSEYLGKLIDYGFSYMEYDSVSFGHFGESGTHGDRPYPMHDAYKILCWSGYDANRGGNQDVFSTAERVFQFFGEGLLITRVKDLEKDRRDIFQVGYQGRSAHEEKTIPNLLRHIREAFPDDLSFLTQTPNGTLAVCGAQCMPWSSTFDRLFNANRKPSRLDDYVIASELVYRLQDAEEKYRLGKWLEGLDMRELIGKETKQREDNLRDAEDKAREVDFSFIGNYELENLATKPEVVTHFISRVKKMIAVKTLLDQDDYREKMAQRAFRFLSSTSLALLNEGMKRLVDLRSSLLLRYAEMKESYYKQHGVIYRAINDIIRTAKSNRESLKFLHRVYYE